MSYKMSDVAKRARVSASTVSRILRNEKKFSFSEKTKQNVFAAVEELGYSTNFAASLFRSKKSRIVGIALQPDNSYATFRIFPKCFRELSELGYSPVVISFTEEMNENSGINIFGNLDLLCGIICLYGNQVLKILEICERQNKNIPIVSLYPGDTESPNLHYVLSDIPDGVLKILDYLEQNGHRKIITAGSAGIPRELALDSAFKKHNMKRIKIDVDMPATDKMFIYGRDSAGKVMSIKDASAVICSNDEFAVGLISGLSRAGVKIPEDISVIGFDDLPFAEFSGNGISTVRQDFEKKAETAAKLIVSLIESTDTQKQFLPKKIKIPCELIVRNSSGRAKE